MKKAIIDAEKYHKCPNAETVKVLEATNRGECLEEHESLDDFFKSLDGDE